MMIDIVLYKHSELSWKLHDMPVFLHEIQVNFIFNMNTCRPKSSEFWQSVICKIYVYEIR